MYKMGLLTGSRTKSANIVGSTMKLNPHGDAAIYDTMVRLSAGMRRFCTHMLIPRGISVKRIPVICSGLLPLYRGKARSALQ